MFDEELWELWLLIHTYILNLTYPVECLMKIDMECVLFSKNLIHSCELRWRYHSVMS
jgi:hypothetical protein